MKRKNNTGFTIYEIIIMISILSVVVFIIAQIMNRIYVNKEGNTLAEQTKHQAGMFSQYLNDMHESNLYVMIDNNDHCKTFNPFKENYTDTWTFTNSDLKKSDFGILYSKDEEHPKDEYTYCHPNKNSYWNEINTGSNAYGQTTCLAVSLDHTGFYHSFIYWVDEKNSKNVSSDILRSAAIRFGSAAGYLVGDQVVGVGGWTLPLNSSIFNNGSCKNKINKNSLVVNLDEYLLMNHSLSSSSSGGSDTGVNFVSRFEDVDHKKDHVDNENALRADIVLNKHAIVFDESNNLQMSVSRESTGINGSLQSNVNISGGIQSEWFNPTMIADVFDGCNESGMIVKAKIKDKSEMNHMSSLLICQQDSLCKNNYCFIPISKQSIRYVITDPNRHSTFTCPNNMYVDVGSEIRVDTTPPNKVLIQYLSGTCILTPSSGSNKVRLNQRLDNVCTYGEPFTTVSYKNGVNIGGNMFYKTVVADVNYTATVPAYVISDGQGKTLRSKDAIQCDCDNKLLSNPVSTDNFRIVEVTCSSLPSLIK